MDAYSTRYDPPAPLVEVLLSHPHKAGGVGYIGLVDTGADISAIPERLVSELELDPLGEIRITGWGKKPIMRPFYLLKVRIQGETIEDTLIVVSTSGAEMLVGRDILNKLNIILEGRSLRFHIMSR